MAEAKLVDTGAGLVPEDEGWFVVNARDARWAENAEFGRYTIFEGEGEARFPEVGINLNVLQPGQPLCYYHGENSQENFLVLAGEAVLVIEGEERPLRMWDFVHCPPLVKHVIVAAGTEPCVLLAIGDRNDRPGLVYPVEEAALRHGAGVERETTLGKEAYAGISKTVARRYADGDLP